ncbi:EAL domain-containing protein [Sulfurimonas sp.]|nr:EAL domain-containing protein [Sulfurimonas sp.]
MNKFLNYTFIFPKIPEFAYESFRSYHIQSDKVMLILLSIQWFIASFITSIHYGTYFYGFFGGALIVVPVLILFRYLKGERYYRYFIAIGMMLFSVIYIQQYLGRIEMHFHVFISLAILTLYKDMMPIILAAATTIIHHIVFNYLQLYEVSLFDMPVMVFNYGCGLDIVILHGIFVVIELLVVGYIIRLDIQRSIDLNISKNEIDDLNKKLEHTSFHDTLTGLPNRLHLNNKISEIMNQAHLNDEKFAIVFLDLDHFKNINDTLGHNIGDALLQTVANILRNNLTKDTLISRIGGDEFIVVISGFKEEKVLLPLINNLIMKFRKEYLVKGYSLRLSTSIGISLFPDDSENINELMQYADIAMYQAKAEGRDNFHFFTQTLNTKVHNEVDIINDMQRALYDNEFELYYQAKVDIKSGKIIGAEALLRWVHPTKGFIPPNVFIPISESTGFILSLGKFVIENGIQAVKKFSDLGYQDLIISLNISTRQFQNTDLYEELNNALTTNKVNPKQIGIEITEGIMMKYSKKILSALENIKKLGISIYLDDFGTGYSSLSYLQQFPIDVLKIDKSFVDNIHKNESNSDNKELLIDTILAMGKSLNLKVIAEGIETKEQYKFLQERDCDIIQGYYFEKPMSEDDFIKLLQSNKTYL